MSGKAWGNMGLSGFTVNFFYEFVQIGTSGGDRGALEPQKFLRDLTLSSQSYPDEMQSTHLLNRVRYSDWKNSEEVREEHSSADNIV